MTDTDCVTQHWCLKIYLVAFCGDYPQSQAMGPWMEAVGAYVPCRGCDYRQDSTMKHEKPFSFFTPGGTWKLREKKTLMRQICAWRQHPDASGMQKAGINKLFWALTPEHFPHINFTNICPQDIMHLFADGITRHEAAWLLYMLHSRKHLRLHQVNGAIRRYRWPRDCRVPQIPDSVEDGAAGRYPRKEATVHMSASQTFTFAVHRNVHPPHPEPNQTRPHLLTLCLAVLRS